MDVLNWMSDHWILTIVLFAIVFFNIGPYVRRFLY